jgi:undecaprenyl-phosphate 4-deoxy-4-formamido-L-arabinose transferase
VSYAAESPATVSVVVPVYNASPTLPELVERITAVMDKEVDEYEVVLVNDGSRDDSWKTIVDLASRYPRARGINLSRNFGQHNALLSGIRSARYEVIVTLDDDLQNPPEEVPALLAHLRSGYDVVYGTPAQERHGIMRNFASRLTKLALQSAMGAETARKVSAFRAFRTHLRVAFADYRGSHVSIDVLLTWGTTSFDSITVAHDVRRQGESNYTVKMLVTHALNMMTGFSTRPLQLASWTGFMFALFGLGVLAYVFGRWVIDRTTVPGFPFLASIIAIFAGAQLFALGIIGEYLARMHFRLMERPPFAIREEVHGEALTEDGDTRRS